MIKKNENVSFQMPVTRTQAVKKTVKTVITRGQRARGMVTSEETSEVENSPQKVNYWFFRHAW